MTDITIDRNNPWELYSDHPQFEAATRDMNAALSHAAKLATWDIARAYMRLFQDKWRDVGAGDSEPRNHIVDRLNVIFNKSVSYYSRRGNGFGP